MKKLLPFAFLLFFAGCASPEEAPAEADAAPIPEVVLDENGNLITTDETGAAETEIQEVDELAGCREENANMSLELEAAQKKLEVCEEDRADLARQKAVEEEAVIPPEFYEYIKKGILADEQPEYAFENCGQMGNFLRKSWFEDFSTKLLAEKIHFSNGYLETTDLLGGCESAAGKMAFFLGAERGDDLQFFLIKYDFTTKKAEAAMMFDGAETATVTALGKRNGATLDFVSDDGRVLKYYYDANIVVVE